MAATLLTDSATALAPPHALILALELAKKKDRAFGLNDNRSDTRFLVELVSNLFFFLVLPDMAMVLLLLFVELTIVAEVNDLRDSGLYSTRCSVRVRLLLLLLLLLKPLP